MPDSTDHDSEREVARLLVACARMDRQSFQQLYELTSPRLLACLIRLLRNRTLAEDALQDVFVQIWRRAAQFRPERGSSWAWIVAIARYRGIDLQRRERRAATGRVDELDSIAAADEPYESLMALGRHAAAALSDCMSALQAQQRDCIVLAYENGLTHAEVADRIGEPLGSVKSWIRRGLVALRRCLES